MGLQSVFSVLISRYSNETDIVIGTPVANREFTETQQLIGFFVNNLVIRNNLSERITFEHLVEQSKETLLHAYEHQHVPFDQLVSRLQPERDLSYSPLFQIMLSLQSHDDAELCLPNATVTALDFDSNSTQYDITLTATEQNDGLALAWEYDTALFCRDRIERMASHFSILVTALLDEPHKPVFAVDMQSEQERALLRNVYFEQQYEQSSCIHHVFERQVQCQPDAIAVVDDEKQYSFYAIEQYANQVAKYLHLQALAPETFVAISMERSVWAVVTVLGVMKAGLAYVPIDYELPEQRISFILDDCNAPLLILDKPERLSNDATRGCLTISIDEIMAFTNEQEGQAEQHAIGTGSQLAYMVYTSGTTGQPKGVMVEHQAMMARHAGWQERFNLKKQPPCVLQMAGLSVDIFLGDIVKSLLNGGKLVLCRKEWMLDIERLFTLIREHHVSFVDVVPTLLRGIMDYAEQQQQNLHTLRHILVGSEAWYGQDLKRLQRIISADCRCFNIYGQTESVIDATCCDVTELHLADDKIVPIGRPLALTEIAVLNTSGQASPIGTVGELAVGGPGLARGYRNLPALTKQKFFYNNQQRRMYFTGDQAILQSDGSLLFLGRIDGQVKIRGYRIELAEVESQLQTLQDVTGAVVIVHTPKQTEQKILVAYLETTKPRSNDFYRAQLIDKLPAYMLPTVFICIPDFPVSVTGKVDRNELPSADTVSQAAEHYVAPTSDTERLLVSIWQEVLGVERVGVTNNFFALGGDSIKMIQVITLAKQHNISVSVKALFAYQSIAALVESGALSLPVDLAVDTEPFSLLTEAEREQIDVQRFEDAYPLTLLQDGSRYHQLKDGNYHLVETFWLDQTWQESAFLETVKALMRQHEILRTSFFNGTERPLQRVHRLAETPVGVEVLFGKAEEDVRAHIVQHIEEEERRFFSDAEMQWRFSVFVITPEQFVVVFSHHHAILDGWSVAAMIKELLEGYTARLEQRTLPDTPTLPKFRDYVDAELSSLQDEQSKTYWQTLMAKSDIPPWHGQGVTQHHTDTLDLSEYYEDIYALSAEIEVPVRTILLAVHLFVLAKICGAERIVSSVVSHGRLEVANSDKCLGLFLNTQPVLATLVHPTWRDFIQSVNKQLMDNWPHRHYPVAQIQRDTGIDLSGALFNFIDFHVSNKLDHLYNEGTELERQITQSNQGYESVNYAFDVTCSHNAVNRELNLQLAISKATFSPSQLKQYLGYFKNLLSGLGQAANASLHGEHLFLGLDELDELMTLGQRRPKVDIKHASLAALFDEQAAQAPDHPAVVSGQTHLTYAELAYQSQLIAHQLMQQGVRSQDHVGLYLASSPELIVAILAIWRIGAVFVPLSTDYPEERLEVIVSDAGIKLILSNKDGMATASLLSERAMDITELLQLKQNPGALPDLPQITNASDEIAYLLYTSGTTGRPKGVQVTHTNVLAYLAGVAKEYALRRNARVMQFSNISFDIFIEELMLSIFSGNSLILVDPEVTSSPARLVEEVVEKQITAISLPTAYWRLLANHLDDCQATRLASTLETCIVGGEAMKSDALMSWQQRLSDKIRLFNTYGPTETTVVASVSDVTHFNATSHHSPDIGRPVSGYACYILTPSLTLAPKHSVGELYIAGPTVSKGYLNRPDASARGFVDLHIAGKHVGHAYRTGDLVKWGVDNKLHYVGRSDEQVKIRGYRVELEEVEANILALVSLQAAIVRTFELDGQTTLCAYLLKEDGELNSENLSMLLQKLGERLPDYMVPRHMAVVNSLPITANGKIDFAKLPDVKRIETAKETIGPSNSVESELVTLYAEMLCTDESDICVCTSFFELGGHSLNAIRLVNRFNQDFGMEFSVSEFLKESTIRALATHVNGAVDAQNSQSELLIPLSQSQCPPLFLVPGAGMSALSFVHLANALEKRLALSVLQDPGFSDRPAFSQLDEMINVFVNTILSSNVQGRVHLAGFSIGACVAFEIALVLKARNIPVTLYMIDTAFTLHLGVGEDVDAEMEELIIATGLEQDSNSLDITRLKNVYASHHYILQYYRPSALLDIPVYGFYGLENQDFFTYRTELEQALSEHITGELHFDLVPGDHFSMLSQEHAEALAQAIIQRFDISNTE